MVVNVDSETWQFTPSTNTEILFGFVEKPVPFIYIYWPATEPDGVVLFTKGKTTNWYFWLSKEAL